MKKIIPALIFLLIPISILNAKEILSKIDVDKTMFIKWDSGVKNGFQNLTNKRSQLFKIKIVSIAKIKNGPDSYYDINLSMHFQKTHSHNLSTNWKRVEVLINPILIGGGNASFGYFDKKKVYFPNSQEQEKSQHYSDILEKPVVFFPKTFNDAGKVYNYVNFSFAVFRTHKIKFNGYVKGIQEDNSIAEMIIDYTVNLTDYDPELLMQTVGTTTNIDSENPDVTIISPKYNKKYYRTTDHIINISGKAMDNEGIASLKINDSRVNVNSQGHFMKKVQLQLGLNNIKIFAKDLFGNISDRELIIYRDEIIEEEVEFSDVDIPPVTNNKNNNGVAIVFGIEDYLNAPNVLDAVNDADIFREYLITTFGFKRDNIYFKLNNKATKAEFDKAFSPNGWISRNTNRNSDVFIYYAGHGAPDIKTKETFLVPYDCDPNYATSTGFSINELYENLSDLNVKSITLIMDACFTGSSRDNQPILADARPVYIEVQPGNIPSNMVVFTASSGNEISSGYSEKNHGIFTYFLLKGLNGNADGNRDRKITVNEMSNYLSENVPQQARKMGREQNPQLLGSDKNRILLAY